MRGGGVGGGGSGGEAGTKVGIKRIARNVRIARPTVSTLI